MFPNDQRWTFLNAVRLIMRPLARLDAISERDEPGHERNQQASNGNIAGRPLLPFLCRRLRRISFAIAFFRPRSSQFSQLLKIGHDCVQMGVISCALHLLFVHVVVLSA